MENRQAEIVNLINNRTMRDLNNACSSSLQPQRPRESNASGIAKKQHHKQREFPSPLSSTEVSLTLSVDDIAQRIASQLDSGKTNHNTAFVDLEAQLTGDESDDLNRRLFNTKESHSKTRISKIIKQVLKICGCAVAATVAVPLIAGGGMITIVVAGVAGIVSIPVLYGINKYRRDLRLDRDPYSYSCVAESVLRLCQILATKLSTARFLKKDCGLEFNVGRKQTDEEIPDGIKDWNEYSVNSNKVRIHFPPEWEIYNDQVFLERETEQHIAEDVVDRNELRVIKCDTRPHVSFEREKPDEGNTDSVRDWGDKDTQSPRVFIKRKPDEGTTQNSKDSGEESVGTHDIHAQVPLEKETKDKTEDNVRDWDEQIILESMRKARAQVLSGIELPASSTEVQTDDEPSSSLPLSSRTVTYYDEPQDSSFKDENPDASKISLEVFDENTEEDEDLSNVEDQDSCDEMSGTASKLTDGREALSDEEDIYGRRDLQCILPRKSFSDTFCCVKVPNDGDGANRRAFVRFRGHDHYEIDTYLNWGIPKQVENKDGTIETQVQGSEEGCTAQKQEMEELPDKEPKKPGKRRRKRRTNKRNATENLNSLAANDADDELDKSEQGQGSLKTSKTPTTEQKNKQNAAQLPGKTTTTKGGKQPKQQLIKKHEDEAKTAEVSPEKTPRKKTNLKKKDKAKKESPAQTNVQSEKPKTKLLRFLTRKNTADPSDCHEQKTRLTVNNNNNSPGAKSSKAVKSEIACAAKIEEEKDRDVISLYDDIDV